MDFAAIEGRVLDMTPHPVADGSLIAVSSYGGNRLWVGHYKVAGLKLSGNGTSLIPMAIHRSKDHLESLGFELKLNFSSSIPTLKRTPSVFSISPTGNHAVLSELEAL